MSNHVGRQSDAVPSTTPAAAGWTRTSRGSVSFGRIHSGQRRASLDAGGSPRTVVPRAVGQEIKREVKRKALSIAGTVAKRSATWAAKKGYRNTVGRIRDVLCM